MKLQNPVAALISVPFQFNYDEKYGPRDASRTTLNIQPVIPISLNDDWNLISRTILPDALSTSDWLAAAYAAGVPMGGDLAKATEGNAPTLLIQAAKEVDGANLDRIQIVKGWVADGKTHEKIYDVALSGDRQPDASGKIAPVGNTVDVAAATYTNAIGAEQLSAAWTDPDFDPAQPAVYYARARDPDAALDALRQGALRCGDGRRGSARAPGARVLAHLVHAVTFAHGSTQ